MSNKSRHQTGQVIERSGSFYIRFYRSKLKDGREVRSRVSEFLCKKDHIHKNENCKAVRELRDAFMLDVNKNSTRVALNDVPVSKFWEDTYLPWARENLRKSSVDGY